MRIVCLFGAGGLAERIDAQHYLRCLFPGRALFSRVEQSQIGRRVGAVIVGEVRSRRERSLRLRECEKGSRF